MDQDGKVTIAAERIGLPAGAKPSEIEDQIYRLFERNQSLEKALGEAVTLAEKRKKSGEDLLKLQAETFVETAVRNQWVDKSEKQYFVEDYIADPVRTTKRIDDRKYKAILARKDSLSDVVSGSIDVDAELDGKVAELMAADEKFRGKPGTAKMEVLKRDAKLAERYRAKHVTGAEKGGETVG